MQTVWHVHVSALCGFPPPSSPLHFEAIVRVQPMDGVSERDSSIRQSLLPYYCPIRCPIHRSLPQATTSLPGRVH